MKRLGWILVACVPWACYVGPNASTDGGSTGDGEGSTEGDPPPASTANDSDPADTSGADGGTTAADGASSDGPVGEESSGEPPPSMCDGGPLAAPIPGCAPTPPPSTGDIHQDCVDRINQFRWECQCLPPLARWTEAEDCSDEQSSLDQNGGGPHGNFGMCGENAQNTCPNWGSEGQVISGCLQAMWDEGPGSPFSEHGHYINMSSTDYSRVACGFSSSGAGVWANQNFSP